MATEDVFNVDVDLEVEDGSAEFDDEKAQKLMDEINDGKRIFDAKGFGRVQVRFPTSTERRKADLEYSKAFSELLDTGIKTNREMEKLLESRGIWTKEDEAAVDKKQNEINQKLMLLGKAKTKKRKQEIREEIGQIREELFLLQQQKQSFFNETVESKAEEARFGYLIYCCAENAETGKPLWKSYDEFQDEENQEGVLQITYQFMTFIRGLPVDFLDYLPEAMLTDDEESAK